MINFYNYKEEKYELIAEPAERLNRNKAELYQTLKMFQFSKLGCLRSAVAGVLLCVAFSLSFQHLSAISLNRLLLDLFLGTLFGTVAYAYLFSVMRVVCLKKLRKIELQQANEGGEDNVFPQSELTADQVFKTALVISVSGFIVVIAGIAMILYQETEQAYLIISAGVISECLAAVIFGFYSRLLLKMGGYQHRPYHLEFD